MLQTFDERNRGLVSSNWSDTGVTYVTNTVTDEIETLLGPQRRTSFSFG